MRELSSFPYQDFFEEIAIPPTGAAVYVTTQSLDGAESELSSHVVGIEVLTVSDDNYSDTLFPHVFSRVQENLFDAGKIVLVRVDTFAFRRRTNFLVVSAREVQEFVRIAVLFVVVDETDVRGRGHDH